MALSLGLDTAVKALRAHQLAVDVASHNIANAQSPGFSRQRVLLRPEGIAAPGFSSYDSLLGKAGMGVSAKDVNRVRDVFLDYQARQTISGKAQYEAFADALGRAELTFSEPGDNGMGAVLAKFFNAWHDVVNDPESPAGRMALIQATKTLTSNMQRAHTDLNRLRGDINQSVIGLKDEINSRAAEIAQLNQQIVQVEASGDSANDLRDRRDLLLDQLAAIGQVSYSEGETGAVSVYFGNHELVSGSNYTAVDIAPDTAPGNAGLQKLVFAGDGMDVTTPTGKLKGLMDARDSAIPDVMAKLDTIASELITQVNSLHSAGFDLDGNAGVAFFTGTGAADIAINPAVAANSRLIAASDTSGAVGSGAIALKIAQLQRSPSAGLGGSTFDQFYGNLVSVLGADVAQAKGMADSNGLLASHIEAQRQGVSGVNLDEEITNLNAAQHAYQSAARVISVIDDMLDTLINRTGVTR